MRNLYPHLIPVCKHTPSMAKASDMGQSLKKSSPEICAERQWF